MKNHSDYVNGVCFLPDKRMASFSWDKTIKIWNLTTEKVELVLDGFEYGVTIAKVVNGQLAFC